MIPNTETVMVHYPVNSQAAGVEVEELALTLPSSMSKSSSFGYLIPNLPPESIFLRLKAYCEFVMWDSASSSVRGYGHKKCRELQ